MFINVMPGWCALHRLLSVVTLSLQPDYIVALAGAFYFSVMIGDADGPASINTIPSCGGASVARAADFNGDGHIGAHTLQIAAFSMCIHLAPAAALCTTQRQIAFQPSTAFV
jgi:hypothetical protein